MEFLKLILLYLKPLFRLRQITILGKNFFIGGNVTCVIIYIFLFIRLRS